MKKTLKTLSVLAFGSLIALSGASYAKAYTTNVQTTTSIDSYVDCDTTVTSMCGDISTAEGMTLVNEEISLTSYNSGTNTTTTYTATLYVNISTYDWMDKDGDSIVDSDEMVEISNGYDIDWHIQMPLTFTQSEANRLINQIAVTFTTNDGNPVAYGLYYNDTTKQFIANEERNGTPTMDLEKSNSTFRITVLNDPTATSSFNVNNVDSNPWDWQEGTSSVVYTKTFNLMDLDSTITQSDSPIMYGNEDLTYNEVDNTIDIEFNIYTNGYNVDALEKDGLNTTSLNISGYLLIPFTQEINGETYKYWYSIMVTGAPFGGANTPYSFITYDDGLHNDGAANDGNYRVVLADSTTAATEDSFNLATSTYYVIDYYDYDVDGTASTGYQFIGPTPSADPNSIIKTGNLSNEAIDPGDVDEDGKDDDGKVVYYENAIFVPQLGMLPTDENGDPYTYDDRSNAIATGFFYSQTFIQSVNTYTPPYEEVWSMSAWAIALIVIGSVAAASAFGFGGYWYSHKHHLKGKYDHHHLERLKHHVAKLEKVVAMDDKKAKEWDAKHHIDHKDTKKKK